MVRGTRRGRWCCSGDARCSGSRATTRQVSAVAGPRQQVELLGPADRCPAVVHAELGVDVPGVSPHGAEGHDELTGDVRAVQVASQKPKDVQLAFAQWLDQAL